MIKAVHILPVLQDNYTYLLEEEGGAVAIVDPGEAAPVMAFLTKAGMKPETILLTHHHGDHVGGVTELVAHYGCHVVGPVYEADKIKSLNQMVRDGDDVHVGTTHIHVIHTPGHTLGQVNYYLPAEKILFSGDTLFSLGCGRVFEGTTQQMFDSLQKLKALPDGVQVYCGHEYTVANAAFVASLGGDIPAFSQYLNEVEKKRLQDIGTMPFSLGLEKEINPFLCAKDVGEFAILRSAKDRF